MPRTVAAYAVRLCGSSRPEDDRADAFISDYVAWGAGPRGSQNLVLAAKARALLEGRTAPTVEDVAPSPCRCCAIASSPTTGPSATVVTAPDIVQHLLQGGRRMSTAPAVSRFLDLRALAALQHLRFSAAAAHRGHATAAGTIPAARRRRRVRRLPRVHRGRGPAPPRLEGAGPHRPGLHASLPGRDEPGLHAGARRQRLDALGGSPQMRAALRISKLEYVQRIASALSHMIGQQQDQVGLAVVADGLAGFVPPGGTPGHVTRLLEEIEGLQSPPGHSAGTRPAQLNRRLAHAVFL